MIEFIPGDWYVIKGSNEVFVASSFVTPYNETRRQLIGIHRDDQVYNFDGVNNAGNATNVTNTFSKLVKFEQKLKKMKSTDHNDVWNDLKQFKEGFYPSELTFGVLNNTAKRNKIKLDNL